MPATSPIHGPTAYERRLSAVDVRAAMSIFDRSFALAAFEQGLATKRGRNGAQGLDKNALQRINRGGHADLSRACMALFLSKESADSRPEKSAYLDLIRQIRDGAAQIATAADALAEQARQYRQDTGEVDVIREGALQDLAISLHGRFLIPTNSLIFEQEISLRPINNRLSDNQVIHGLSGCAALSNEANSIAKLNIRNNELIDQSGSRSARVNRGNRANHERDAFVRDISVVYRHVLRIRPAAPSNGDGKSPFMRFIEHIFLELQSQTVCLIGPHAYVPPSAATVRKILKHRKSGSCSSKLILPGQSSVKH